MSSNEQIGNYEVTKAGIVTRREVLLMGAVAASTLAGVAGAVQAATPVAAAAAPSGKDPYVAKDFSALKMDGFTANQINSHLKLYNGYIAKSNEIHTKLGEADLTNPNATYSPLRELLMEQSFAVNGAVYHELYFGNLGGKGGDPSGEVKAALEERFGSTGKFMDLLKAAGKCMRGWVIVGYNTRGGYIDTFGLDMHNMWSPAATIPLLVLDVYEHAYMIDYGIDRAKYLDAFAKNLDWDVVGKRLAMARKHPVGSDSTT